MYKHIYFYVTRIQSWRGSCPYMVCMVLHILAWLPLRLHLVWEYGVKYISLEPLHASSVIHLNNIFLLPVSGHSRMRYDRVPDCR